MVMESFKWYVLCVFNNDLSEVILPFLGYNKDAIYSYTDIVLQGMILEHVLRLANVKPNLCIRRLQVFKVCHTAPTLDDLVEEGFGKHGYFGQTLSHKVLTKFDLLQNNLYLNSLPKNKMLPWSSLKTFITDKLKNRSSSKCNMTPKVQNIAKKRHKCW